MNGEKKDHNKRPKIYNKISHTEFLVLYSGRLANEDVFGQDCIKEV